MFNPNEHMMNLKGKDYLQVMWRLVWFREDHPDWCIDTTLMEHTTGDGAVFCAKILDADGRQVSSGWGSETKKDFGDYLEKAETKAVGRALAMLGYGAQFTADDLDEGKRIVDSPVERQPKKTAEKPAEKPKAEEPKETPKEEKSAPQSQPEPVKCEVCGKEIVGYLGKNGKPIPIRDGAEYSRKTFGKVLCQHCFKLAEKTA